MNWRAAAQIGAWQFLEQFGRLLRDYGTKSCGCRWWRHRVVPALDRQHTDIVEKEMYT
jgi:hypothetical protein